jgi:hypothetical protein
VDFEDNYFKSGFELHCLYWFGKCKDRILAADGAFGGE